MTLNCDISAIITFEYHIHTEGFGHFEVNNPSSNLQLTTWNRFPCLKYIFKHIIIFHITFVTTQKKLVMLTSPFTWKTMFFTWKMRVQLAELSFTNLKYMPVIFTSYDMDFYGVRHIRGALHMYQSLPSPICQHQRCYFIHLDKGVLKFKNSLRDYFCENHKHQADFTHLSWAEAEQKCLEQNAHLVSINSHEEMWFLQGILRFSYHESEHMFIGLMHYNVSIWEYWTLRFTVFHIQTLLRNKRSVRPMCSSGRWPLFQRSLIGLAWFAWDVNVGSQSQNIPTGMYIYII